MRNGVRIVVYDDIEVNFDFDTDVLIRTLKLDKAKIAVNELVKDGKISLENFDVAVELFVRDIESFNELYDSNHTSIECF